MQLFCWSVFYFPFSHLLCTWSSSNIPYIVQKVNRKKIYRRFNQKIGKNFLNKAFMRYDKCAKSKTFNGKRKIFAAERIKICSALEIPQEKLSALTDIVLSNWAALIWEGGETDGCERRNKTGYIRADVGQHFQKQLVQRKSRNDTPDLGRNEYRIGKRNAR